MSLKGDISADLAAHTHRRGLGGFLVTLLCSPGFATVFMYRMAVASLRLGLVGKLLARVIWRVNTGRSGCYLSLKSSIGPGLQLPHAVAVVIGDGVKIGSGVTLYQSVTLGTPQRESAQYPVIGNDVTIFAGAVVAGALTIGDGAVIGANSFVSKNVAPGCLAAGAPARELRKIAPSPIVAIKGC